MLLCSVIGVLFVKVYESGLTDYNTRPATDLFKVENVEYNRTMPTSVIQSNLYIQ